MAYFVFGLVNTLVKNCSQLITISCSCLNINASLKSMTRLNLK